MVREPFMQFGNINLYDIDYAIGKDYAIWGFKGERKTHRTLIHWTKESARAYFIVNGSRHYIHKS